MIVEERYIAMEIMKHHWCRSSKFNTYTGLRKLKRKRRHTVQNVHERDATKHKNSNFRRWLSFPGSMNLFCWHLSEVCRFIDIKCVFVDLGNNNICDKERASSIWTAKELGPSNARGRYYFMIICHLWRNEMVNFFIEFFIVSLKTDLFNLK